MTSIEFPRKPGGLLKRHIADEADGRLGFYLPPPEDIPPVEGQPDIQKHELPPGVFDAPLVRLYNFLRMSLGHNIFILHLNYVFRNDVYVVSIGDTMVPGARSAHMSYKSDYRRIPASGGTSTDPRLGRISQGGDEQ